MTFAEAVTDVRERTDQDLPAGALGEEAKVRDSTIKRWVIEELHPVRRVLAVVVPTLFMKSTTFTVAPGDVAWTTAADFDRVYRLERRDPTGGDYEPLGLAQALNPEDMDDLSFLEQGTTLQIYPSGSAPGDYRLLYIKKQVLTGDNDPLELPEGAHVPVCERAAAKVRRRLEEDPTPHLQAAQDSLKELKSYLQDRYGAHLAGLIERR